MILHVPVVQNWDELVVFFLIIFCRDTELNKCILK